MALAGFRFCILSAPQPRHWRSAAKLLIARIEDAENVRWLPVFVPVELLNGGTVGRIG